VEGTLAKQILAEPEEIVTLAGLKLPRKCQVEYISFSAHTDYYQTSEFIRTLRPPHIVLVHGEATEMNRLKCALQREYEDDDNPPTLHNPRNTQGVQLHFRGEKTAKVMGTLAVNSPKPGHKLSGVLVKRNFTYHLLDPTDLGKYTDLVMSTISQKLSVHFNGSYQDLVALMSQFVWEVVEGKGGAKSLRVFKSITLTLPPGSDMVTLEWVANPVHDMYADAIVALLLKQKSGQSGAGSEDGSSSTIDGDTLLASLRDMFGIEEIQSMAETNGYSFMVDGTEVEVDLNQKSVLKCEDESIRFMVQKLLSSSSNGSAKSVALT
jgi:cleavage and polyadenylation specificity factor subunit 3